MITDDYQLKKREEQPGYNKAMKKHTDLNPHWIDQQDDFTGENGLQVTTWAFCWVCGKKISPNRQQESRDGVHNKCSTAARLDAGIINSMQLVLYISPDEKIVNVGTQHLVNKTFCFRC